MRSKLKSKLVGCRGSRGLASLGVLGCVALAFSLAAPADAAPAWLPPVNVSEDLPEYPAANVAMDARGDATAAWQACSFEQSIYGGAPGTLERKRRSDRPAASGARRFSSPKPG